MIGAGSFLALYFLGDSVPLCQLGLHAGCAPRLPALTHSPPRFVPQTSPPAFRGIHHPPHLRNWGKQTCFWVRNDQSELWTRFGVNPYHFIGGFPGIAATNLEPIYWNSLNKRFSDDDGYILYPQIGDRLDLICPASEPPGPRAPAEYEFYKLYLMSSREQADRCKVTGASKLLLTCDRPNYDMRFTIRFLEFSPFYFGLEFKTMHDYYIIATSDGTRQGLESMRGGVCATQGMKVVLKVGQSPYRPNLKPSKPDQTSRTTLHSPSPPSRRPSALTPPTSYTIYWCAQDSEHE